MGEFYDTKDSKIIENEVDLPTIYEISDMINNVKKYILPNKKNVERGKFHSLKMD